MRRYVAAAVACLNLGSLGAEAVPLDSLRHLSIQPDLAGDRATALVSAVTQGKPEMMGVRLNGVAQSAPVLVVRLPNGSVAVPATAIAAWRLHRPTARTLRFEGDDYVLLDNIAGIQWREDTADQLLVLQVPVAAFVENELEVVDQAGPTQTVAPLGGFVSYDLQWQGDAQAGAGASSRRANGLIEAGIFNAYGNGVASGVWRSGGQGGQGASAFTRLDTTWNIDMPSSLSSVRLGDAISVPGAWGRSVRYGGVQWATNFAVQPGLVTFPMPSIRGEATVPSIVDLYINNTHQLQGKVPAGAFDLPDVPVITGQGQITMVVRDVLGREQVIVQPYYVSRVLLRPGLRDFAIDVGAVRENYGFDSQRYGRVFVTATERVGVTPEFTREVRAEILRDQQTVGLTGVWQLKQQATAHASVAASRGPDGPGWLSAVGIDHQNRSWSANTQLRLASRNFSALGDETGSGGPQRSALTAGIAAVLGTGSVGVNVLQQSTWKGDSYGLVSANYGRALGSLGYVSLFASRTFGSVHATTVGVNLISSFPGNVSASVGTYRSRDRLVSADGSLGAAHTTGQTAIQIQGNAPVGPGIGYQVLAERGSFERFSAQGTLQGERAAVTAGIARLNGANSYQLGVRGAVALMPEGVYLSHRIDSSFAVVQVGDYGGIRVNRDNQLVARTDEKGRAFVTGLRGFESNQISIEQKDLPLDAQVDRLKIDITPGMRSGVSVLFPVRRARAASLRLVTADGVPVPPGVQVQIEGDSREFPVGFDGKLFLVGLRDINQISAQWSGQRCTAQITLDAALDDVPELGTRVCK